MATSPNSRRTVSPEANRARGSAVYGPPTKKALLIGIKYSNQVGKLVLKAPYKDIDRVRSMLMERFGYDDLSITMMRDDLYSGGTDRWPNKVNMQLQMEALVRDVKPGDRRFFMFSGHGIQPGGQAFQAVQPVDGFDDSGKIVTGNLFFNYNLAKQLIAPIPANDCTFTALFDCCWSKNILELDVSSLHSSQQRALTRRSTLDFGLLGSVIPRWAATASLDDEQPAPANRESLVPDAGSDQSSELSSSAQTVTGPIAKMNIGSLRSSPVATMNRGHHPRPHLDHQQSEDPSHSTWTLVSSETSELQDHQPPGTPHTFHSAWSDGYVREDTPDASSVLSGSQGSGVGPLELPVEVYIDESGETVESVPSSQDGYSVRGGSSIGDDHEYQTFATAMEHDFEDLQADEMLVDNYSNTSNRGDSPIQTRGGTKQTNFPPPAGVVGRDYAPNMPSPTSVIICWSNKTNISFEYGKYGLLTDAIVTELEKQPIPSYVDLFRGVKALIAQRCDDMNREWPEEAARKQEVQLTRRFPIDYSAQVHP